MIPKKTAIKEGVEKTRTYREGRAHPAIIHICPSITSIKLNVKDPSIFTYTDNDQARGDWARIQSWSQKD